MKAKKIVDELKKALKESGVEVRSEKGNFRGGNCILGEQQVVVLNRHHLPEVQLAVLARAAQTFPIDVDDLPKAVVQALENAWAPEQELSMDDVE